MDIHAINNRISTEVSHYAISLLSDENMVQEYSKCKSVIDSKTRLETILKNHNLDKNTVESIINDYAPSLIPAGTKGVMRGVKFNHIVKLIIMNMKLEKQRFDIHFEEYNTFIHTDEKPDWFITDVLTGRTIIGMNQLDFWNGGHQLNRGYKYIINNPMNTETCKFLSVICNNIQLKTEKSKLFNLFQTGFSNNTLCYIKNLPNIIRYFFNLPKPY